MPRFEQLRSGPFSATWVLASSLILTVIELVWLSPVIWCITVVWGDQSINRQSAKGFLLLHHTDDGQRAFVEEYGLAQRIDIRAEEFFFGVLVNHDDSRLLSHRPHQTGGLIPASAAHVEILFAHAVQRGGQVSIAVGRRAAGGGLRRGGSDVALFGDDFGVVSGQRFNPAAAPVAEAAPGEDADGIRPHRADVCGIFSQNHCQSDDGHDEGDTDDDAEHGQKRAHFLRHNRLHRHFEGFRQWVVIKQPRRFFFDAFILLSGISGFLNCRK